MLFRSAYQILVPLMLANMVSYLISSRFQPLPLYQALLEQDGVHLPGPESRSAVGAWRARDIMTEDVLFIPREISVEEACKLIGKSQAICFPVGNRERLTGLVTRKSLEEARTLGKTSEPVASLMSNSWTHAYPDHPLEIIFERFSENPGLLPVLSRGQDPHVLGVITRDTIINFLEKSP